MKFVISIGFTVCLTLLIRPLSSDEYKPERAINMCSLNSDCRMSDVATKEYNAGNYKSAYLIFKRSCSDGDARGCFGVGLLLDEGKGVKEDPELARDYFNSSCVSGFTTGCFYMGASLKKGSGGEKDLASSHRYFLIASGENQPRACFNIALNYYDGIGVQQDRSKAHKFNDKSCKLGEPKACYNLAYMYETGQGKEVR